MAHCVSRALLPTLVRAATTVTSPGTKPPVKVSSLVSPTGVPLRPDCNRSSLVSGPAPRRPPPPGRGAVWGPPRGRAGAPTRQWALLSAPPPPPSGARGGGVRDRLL